jgi:hypothetical protein
VTSSSSATKNNWFAIFVNDLRPFDTEEARHVGSICNERSGRKDDSCGLAMEEMQVASNAFLIALGNFILSSLQTP